MNIEHYISRLTPNVYALNALLIAPHFYRRFGRLPRRPSRPDANYHDFLVDRMARNDWSELHLKCADKEHAKAVALELAPNVKVPLTIEVIPTPRGVSLDYLKERPTPHLGKHLVAKPTQGSGTVLFLKDVDDRNLLNLFRATRYNYFYSFRETQYHRLKSKIIIEEELSDSRSDLPDYKFFCAKGAVLFAQIDFGRFSDHRRLLLAAPDFEPFGNHLKLGAFEPPASWQRPVSFEEMTQLACQLSKPFDFVRIDLYNSPQGIFLGEFTFTPGAGLEPFSHTNFSEDLMQQIAQA